MRRAAAVREADDSGLYRGSPAGLHLGSLRGGGRERGGGGEGGPPRRWPQAGVATEAGEGPAKPSGSAEAGAGPPGGGWIRFGAAPLRAPGPTRSVLRPSEMAPLGLPPAALI